MSRGKQTSRCSKWDFLFAMAMGTSLMAADSVKTQAGSLRNSEQRCESTHLQRTSLSPRPPVGALRWKAAATCRELDWRASGVGIRPALHARNIYWRYGFPRQRAE